MSAQLPTLGTEEVATPNLGLAMTVLLYLCSFRHSNVLKANKKDNEVSLRTEHTNGIVFQSPLPRKYDPRSTHLTPRVFAGAYVRLKRQGTGLAPIWGSPYEASSLSSQMLVIQIRGINRVHVILQKTVNGSPPVHDSAAGSGSSIKWPSLSRWMRWSIFCLWILWCSCQPFHG